MRKTIICYFLSLILIVMSIPIVGGIELEILNDNNNRKIPISIFDNYRNCYIVQVTIHHFA